MQIQQWFLTRLMAIFDIHILTWSDYLLLWINFGGVFTTTSKNNNNYLEAFLDDIYK